MRAESSPPLTSLISLLNSTRASSLLPNSMPASFTSIEIVVLPPLLVKERQETKEKWKRREASSRRPFTNSVLFSSRYIASSTPLLRISTSTSP